MKNLINLLAICLVGFNAFSQINYDYSRAITISETVVDGSDDMEDFVLFFTLTDDSLRSVSNGGHVTSENGYDIQFGAPNCSVYYDHQIESYDPTTGTINAWVRLPVLGALAPTKLFLFYGDNTITTDLSTESTWSSAYDAVWHMDGDSISGVIEDNAGTENGQTFGMVDSNYITGKVGNAIEFDGVDDYVALNKFYTVGDSISEITLSGWVKTTYNVPGAINTNWSVIDFDRGDFYSFYVAPDGRAAFSFSNESGFVNDFIAGDPGQLSDDEWHYMVATYDGLDAKIYIDGQLEGVKAGALGGQPIYAPRSRYGYMGDGSESGTYNSDRNEDYYEGSADELRILDSLRTAEWILAEYNNQNDPSSFYTVAGEVDVVNIEAGMDQTVCFGEMVTLSGANAIDDVYTWSDGVMNGVAFTAMGTNTYQVVALNSVTCLDSATVNVFVNDLPSVMAISSSDTICLGGSITLSGAGAETYAWDIIDFTDGDSYTPATEGEFTFDVTGTDVNGCVNIDSVTVFVSNATITAAVEDDLVCLGDSITVSSMASAGMVTWSDGIVEGEAFVSTVVGDTYYYATVVNGQGCEAIDSVLVTVSEYPTIDALIDVEEICLGESVVLTSLASAGTVTWSGGIVEGEEFTPTVEGEMYFYVSTVNAAGCEAIDSVVVMVNELATVEALVDTAFICLGDEIILSSVSSETTVTWETGIVEGTAFAPTTIGDNYFSVTAVNAAGCEVVDSVLVVVNALPVVDATVTDETVCLNDTVVFEGTGADSYEWDNAVVDGDDYILTAVGTVMYHVTGTDVNGCVAIDSIAVTVNGLPVIEAAVDQTEVCEDVAVVFSATGADTYEWTNGVVGGEDYVPSGIGTVLYHVTGTDANGCVAMDSIEVTVIASPITLDAVSTDEILGTDGEIDLTVTGGSSVYTFDWDNDEAGDFDDTEDLTGLVSGTYVVIVNDDAGCTATLTVEVSSQLSVDELTKNKVTLYPNPAVNQFQVIGLDNLTGVNVFVFDSNGKKVEVQQLLSGTYTMQNVSTGVYYVQIFTNENEPIVKKLIVE